MTVPSVKQLNGLRYVVPLREGGSLPAVVETDEPGPYVVKFRGAGQGAKALIAELLAAGIAAALGLPVPSAAIVTLGEGFGQSEPDPEIQDILRGSTGQNFGLAYLADSIVFDPVADREAVDPALAAAIVWFDAYITNVDRTARNTNMLRRDERLYLIDHGASLYFQHRWEGHEDRIHAPFPQIGEHVLLPFVASAAIQSAGARLRPLLTEAVVRRIVDTIPEAWLLGEPYFADQGLTAHREAYAHYLIARLAGPRSFEREAIDAATRLV